MQTRLVQFRKRTTPQLTFHNAQKLPFFPQSTALFFTWFGLKQTLNLEPSVMYVISLTG